MAIRPTIKEENPEADFGEIVSWVYFMAVFKVITYFAHMICTNYFRLN